MLHAKLPCRHADRCVGYDHSQCTQQHSAAAATRSTHSTRFPKSVGVLQSCCWQFNSRCTQQRCQDDYGALQHTSRALTRNPHAVLPPAQHAASHAAASQTLLQLVHILLYTRCHKPFEYNSGIHGPNPTANQRYNDTCIW